MRKTSNKIQETYILAKAHLQALEEQEREVDQEYIAKNGILNHDGSIPRASWAIDDELLADKAIEECSKMVNESGLWDEILIARNNLDEAEENLVQYGISLMPGLEEKELLKEAVTKNYMVRKKVIDLTTKLDSGTVKR